MLNIYGPMLEKFLDDKWEELDCLELDKYKLLVQNNFIEDIENPIDNDKSEKSNCLNNLSDIRLTEIDRRIISNKKEALEEFLNYFSLSTEMFSERDRPILLDLLGNRDVLKVEWLIFKYYFKKIATSKNYFPDETLLYRSLDQMEETFFELMLVNRRLTKENYDTHLLMKKNYRVENDKLFYDRRTAHVIPDHYICPELNKRRDLEKDLSTFFLNLLEDKTNSRLPILSNYVYPDVVSIGRILIKNKKVLY